MGHEEFLQLNSKLLVPFRFLNLARKNRDALFYLLTPSLYFLFRVANFFRPINHCFWTAARTGISVRRSPVASPDRLAGVEGTDVEGDERLHQMLMQQP